MEKSDENRNFEKYAAQKGATNVKTTALVSNAPCCVIL